MRRNMKKLFKALAAVGGVGIAAYAVSQRGKSKKKSDVWNTFAPVYDLFVSKGRKAYEEMYRRIRAAVGGKRVLKPGGLLIAPNFLDHRSGGVKSALAKFLTAAGVVFEVTWDEAGYLAFLEKKRLARP